MRRARDVQSRWRPRSDRSAAPRRRAATATGSRWTAFASRSEFVCLFGEIVGEIDCDLARLVLVEQVLDHKLREVSAVNPPGYVMPRRDRAERTRVVVEANRVVEAGGLRCQFAEAAHAFRRVI